MFPSSRSGRVVAFDGPRGLGRLEADDGTTWSFHCTAIADGSRTIEVDTPVSFVERPGPGGEFEAWGITPLENRG